MNAFYQDELDDIHECKLLACGIGQKANHCLIELNSDIGWCPDVLIEEQE